MAQDNRTGQEAPAKGPQPTYKSPRHNVNVHSWVGCMKFLPVSLAHAYKRNYFFIITNVNPIFETRMKLY